MQALTGILAAFGLSGSANVITDIHPAITLTLGLLVAGGVHAAKSVVLRPVVTATTGGVANPLVSVVEDLVAATISIAAVVLPVLIAVLLILFTAFVLWWLWRGS